MWKHIRVSGVSMSKEELEKKIEEYNEELREHGYYCYGCGDCDELSRLLDEAYKKLKGNTNASNK